jgi:hypothetical protein
VCFFRTSFGHSTMFGAMYLGVWEGRDEDQGDEG